MSAWTTLRDDLIPYQWFKHGGNRKDWARRAAEAAAAFTGASYLPSLMGTAEGATALNAASQAMPQAPAGIPMAEYAGMQSQQAAGPGLLGALKSAGGAMSPQKAQMAMMAMNMMQPAPAPPPAPPISSAGGQQVPPTPSPYVDAGMQYGKQSMKRLPGESDEDFLKRVRMQGGLLA